MEIIPDSFRDLLTADFATLATVGKSGGPQQSIVWFLAEDDVVRLSFNGSRQKRINLFAATPPAASLSRTLRTAYRYIELRGSARDRAGPDYTFADKVGAKYGSDLRQHDLPGDKSVTWSRSSSTAPGGAAGRLTLSTTVLRGIAGCER